MLPVCCACPQEHMEARIRALEACLDARVVTVINRAGVEEVGPAAAVVCAYKPGGASMEEVGASW